MVMDREKRGYSSLGSRKTQLVSCWFVRNLGPSLWKPEPEQTTVCTWSLDSLLKPRVTKHPLCILLGLKICWKIKFIVQLMFLVLLSFVNCQLVNKESPCFV